MATCQTCAADLPAAARFCPACGAGVRAPAEERKLATVLFADLVGSTSLGESQDPERTRALLERFYEAMAAEVEAAGGTLEKFVGDSVQAAFGAPAAQEDHAERALHAALAMQRRLRELYGDTLQMRIGVNTGEIVVGDAWAGGSWLTGDAVNVGKRLEQAADPGAVLVGERTAAAAGVAFEFGEERLVEAKGKRAPVVARPLLRALSLMRPRGAFGARTEFVGREAEIELLLATYRRAVRDGSSHVVAVIGESGVGKSRLVRELWERLGAESPVPLRRTGRCLSYGRGITYFALGEVLKEHLGILESDSPDEVVAKLGRHAVLGPTLGLDVAGDVHPLAAREQLHEGWVSFLSELAADRPTVLLVEDVHWAEDPLLELLQRVVRDVRSPLLVLATARPELVERWVVSGRNATTLWLEPLSREDAGRLVVELGGALPAETCDAVVARAEGNPFFLEEIMASLAFGGAQAGDLPDSVQAVLAARIDLLPPCEKAALQAAAVVGRVFWASPVRELVGGEDPDFALLEERDFIRRRPGSTMAGEQEYAIKHALTREVAYASIPRARRARLHADFAGWLEQRGGGRDEHAPLLAHHYAEAVRPDDADLAWRGDEGGRETARARAVHWLRRAAELALARHDIEDTLALLQRAVELELDPRVLSELWREVGHAQALRYDGPAFWDAMERSLAICTDRATCAQSYSELAFQTAIRSGMWKRQPGREQIEGWIAQALELAEPGSPARARALLARAHCAAADGEEAALEASALAEQLGDVALRSYALGSRCIVAFHHGRFAEAVDWTTRRLELAGELSDPDHVVEIYETAIPAFATLGRWDRARELADAHAAASRQLSPHHRLHSVALAVEIDEAIGRWDAIHGSTGVVEEAVIENASTPCVRNARTLLLCACACALAGEERRMRELLRAADDTGITARSLASARLRLALVRWDVESARELVEDGSEVHYYAVGPAQIATRLDALAALRDSARLDAEAAPLAGSESYLQPFALRALGIVRDDRPMLERADERFRALGLDWHRRQTAVLLAGAPAR